MTKFICHLLCLLCITLSFCVSERTPKRSLAILFPDANGDYEEAIVDAQNREFEDEVNSLQTIQDFVNYFDLNMVDEVQVSTRFGGNTAKEVISLPIAECEPQTTTVKLDLPDENAMMYVPTCVRVKRCGGCCNLDYQSCQPVQTKTVNVEFMKFSKSMMTPKRGRSRVRKNAVATSIPVEVHTQCECRCQHREEDCNLDIHIYYQQKCLCVCRDIKARERCFTSSKHRWVNELCDCQCRNVETCSVGQTFDQNLCSCQ